MNENQAHIFVAVFDNEFEAKETLAGFEATQRARSINLIDAALVVRQAERA